MEYAITGLRVKGNDTRSCHKNVESGLTKLNY